MTRKAPGKAHREGLTLVQLMDMFPTEEAAAAWFESVVWPDRPAALPESAGRCNTREASRTRSRCRIGAPIAGPISRVQAPATPIAARPTCRCASGPSRSISA